jgi:type IV secretory pathway VirB2 component (pilin)
MPIVAFYVPAILFASLGFMVGYSMDQMREVLLVVGGVAGVFAASMVVLLFSLEHTRPIWFYIKGEKDE